MKISQIPVMIIMYCFLFIFVPKFLSLSNVAVSLLTYCFISGKVMTYSTQFLVPLKKQKACLETEKMDDKNGFSLLDLTDLALELILERLDPKALSNMTCVCSYLREKCVSDHLWGRHMRQKWGRLIGDAAKMEWQCHIASTKKSTVMINKEQKVMFGYVPKFWPLFKDKLKGESKFSPLSDDSIMAWYLALETGKFWFPAQVYNREVRNGNIGFLLSCYDADLGYDSGTDSFKARYSPQGRSTIEYNVEWDRVRPPAVDTSSRSLHTSGFLDDLSPGDHIEIQWRRNTDFPYGWWYGVVSHMDSCDGIKTHCQCRNNDTVILEFKQYTPESRWRKTKIKRKEHREIGNKADGFYGGIRKVYRDDEISLWKGLWPTQVLE